MCGRCFLRGWWVQAQQLAWQLCVQGFWDTGLGGLGRLKDGWCGWQAQAMRTRAEEYFQMHRERGGFAAMRDPGTPREVRNALFELKKRGNLLWQRAAELVQAAGESVLRDSQVRQ